MGTWIGSGRMKLSERLGSGPGAVARALAGASRTSRRGPNGLT